MNKPALILIQRYQIQCAIEDCKATVMTVDGGGFTDIKEAHAVAKSIGWHTDLFANTAHCPEHQTKIKPN